MLFCQDCNKVYEYIIINNQVKFNCKLCNKQKEIENEIEEILYEKVYAKKEILQYNKGNKTEITCSKCFNNEAYYNTFQSRSADEPETIIYKCTKCLYT